MPLYVSLVFLSKKKKKMKDVKKFYSIPVRKSSVATPVTTVSIKNEFAKNYSRNY